MKKNTKANSPNASQAASGAATTSLTSFNPFDAILREKDMQAATDRALKSLGEHAQVDSSLNSIQEMDARGITMLQATLEHGGTLGRWVTPVKWAGGLHLCMRDIDLRERIVSRLEQRHSAMVREATDELSRMQQEAECGAAKLLPTASLRVLAILDGAVLTATRYLLLCRLGPAGMGNAKGRPMDTTTLMHLGYLDLPALLAVGVGKRLDNVLAGRQGDDSTSGAMIGYLAFVQPEDLVRFSGPMQVRLKKEVRRAQVFADRGLWADCPPRATQLAPVTAVKGVAQPLPRACKPREKHLPLPDEYVAEMGRKSLWIIQELGPNLLTIANEIVRIWQRLDNLTLAPSTVSINRSAVLAEFLSKFVWRDSQGNEFARPPFEIRLSKLGKKSRNGQTSVHNGENVVEGPQDNDGRTKDPAPVTGTLAEQTELFEWPPRAFPHFSGLMALLQSAHLFVVGMSAAPRKMELLSLERDCVVRASDGTPFARGRTFKLVERNGGELRDWVLPDLATEAIEQQVRLANVMEIIGPQKPRRTPDNQRAPLAQPGRHMWAQHGSVGGSDRTKPLMDVNQALLGYARALGMSVNPGGQNIRVHRFRKTMARLAALALTDAPLILMQVFGHRSIEMTLYYILTDRDLQVEVEEVRRELKIMRGVAVVEDMATVAMADGAEEARQTISRAKGGPDTSQNEQQGLPNAGYGGPAAPKLFGAVKERVVKVYRTGREWGASDSYDTAYFLTEAGLTFTMPREGVFCTKAFTQPAACTGKRGKTDPGNCQTDCGHRLELAARRAQLEASLHKQVGLYEEARREGHELLWKGLAKKIRDTLKPFDDLREKWMQHPTVRQVVEAAGEMTQ